MIPTIIEAGINLALIELDKNNQGKASKILENIQEIIKILNEKHQSMTAKKEL